MNPILAIDFSGALLKPRPFDEAHRRWFKLFSVLLEDDSINDWTFKENYFDGVHEVMTRYLGGADAESQTMFARELYAMVLLAEVRPDDLYIDFANCLRLLKEKYTLALITTAPESSVVPILRKLHCHDLFDIIYSSKHVRRPDKKGLFEDFIVQYERPLFYIGAGDKELGHMRELGIKTICVSWSESCRFKGDHDVGSAEELKRLLYLT